RPPPHAIIQRGDVHPSHQPGHRHLTASPPAPHLGDHAAMAHRHTARLALPLDQGHHVPVTALDRDERPGIQHQHVRQPRAPPAPPAPPFGPAPGSPRTPPARPRARRAASPLPASVISPCSASTAATNPPSARSRRSCATFRRSASFTPALTLSAHPWATA